MSYTLNPYRRAHAIDLYTRAATLRERLHHVTRDGERLRILAVYRYGKRVARIETRHERDSYYETETDFGTLTETGGVVTLTTPFGQTTYPADDDQYTFYDRLHQNAECARSLLWRAAHDDLTPDEEPMLIAHLTSLDAFLLRETFTRKLALSYTDDVMSRFHALLDEWLSCDDDRFVRDATPHGDLYRYHRRSIGIIRDNQLVTPIGTRRIQKDAPHKTWANLRKTLRRQLNQWMKQRNAERYDPSPALIHAFYALEGMFYLWDEWSREDELRHAAKDAPVTYTRDLCDTIAAMHQSVANNQRLMTFHPEDEVDYARPVASFADDKRLHLLRRLCANPDHALHRLQLVKNGADADVFDYTPYVAFDAATGHVTLTFAGQTEPFARVQHNRYGNLTATVGDRYHVLDRMDETTLPPVLVQDVYATFVTDSVRALRLTERLADYDAAPLDRSKRDLLFHSLPHVALVEHHVFVANPTRHVPHAHHIRRLLQEAYRSVRKAEDNPYGHGPLPKRYQEKALHFGLLDNGYDPNDTAISALRPKQRLALLHDDVRHLTYLATLASGHNTAADAIARPERQALLHLFERHIALAQPQANEHPSDRLRRKKDAYTDIAALLHTDWYDTLPEVLEVDR